MTVMMILSNTVVGENVKHFSTFMKSRIDCVVVYRRDCGRSINLFANNSVLGPIANRAAVGSCFKRRFQVDDPPC